MGAHYIFDDDSYETTVTCPKCKKTYRQVCEDQEPGFRMRDEDICPYCGNVNGSSMSVEYTNYPL